MDAIGRLFQHAACGSRGFLGRQQACGRPVAYLQRHGFAGQIYR
jgi:hypothetical protein